MFLEKAPSVHLTSGGLDAFPISRDLLPAWVLMPSAGEPESSGWSSASKSKAWYFPVGETLRVTEGVTSQLCLG